MITFKIADHFKKFQKAYYLLIYFLLLFIIVVIDNFGGPKLYFRFINNAVKSFPIYYVIQLIFLVFILPKRFFRWSWSNINTDFNNILFSIVLIVFVSFGFIYSNSLLFKTLCNQISLDYFIFCLFVLMLIAFVEEFLFREIIFKELRFLFNNKYKVVLSILISSLLFAIAHIPKTIVEFNNFDSGLLYLLKPFIFGLFACIIYYKTQNFFLIVILHMFCDFDIIFLNAIHFKQFDFVLISWLIALIITIFVFLFKYYQKIRQLILLAIVLVVMIWFYSDFSGNDKIIEFYNNGAKKATIGNDSIMTLYDSTEKIWAFGKFLNGRKVGNWIEYNNDGTIKWQGEYSEKTNNEIK